MPDESDEMTDNVDALIERNERLVETLKVTRDHLIELRGFVSAVERSDRQSARRATLAQRQYHKRLGWALRDGR